MSRSGQPDIAVVVASDGRLVRLRWLLNALSEQTFPRTRFEVVVAFSADRGRTRELLASHPLSRAGALRYVELTGARGTPGRNRNAGWRVSRAPLVAFTDDDCRPTPQWLESVVAAVERHPGAIVQGATQPDPDEIGLEAAAAHPRTQRIVPPTPWGQACNIVYPRRILEELGGFREDVSVGEDADLIARAREYGIPHVGASDVEVYHAVHVAWIGAHLRTLARWADLPALVKRRPEMRSYFPLWVFWKRRHAWLPLAIAGAVKSRRAPPYAALCLPWAVHALPQQYGHDPYGRLRGLFELAGQLLIDGTEIGVLAWGSVKHRTLLL